MSGSETFNALVLEEEAGKVTPSLQKLSADALPEGEVTVDIAYSDLNYKDGMVINGIGRMVRKYPHVPGIDFSGTVAESKAPEYKPGDRVILTGWLVGEHHWGGYAQKARVKADWLVPLPEGLDLKRAMALGTAGFTAMLAVMAIEKHGAAPDQGEVLVTGASGGLGSVAVAVLSRLGYRVAAVTGREESHAYLKELGAATIVDRSELSEPPRRPLEKPRWRAAIDTVGGATLSTILHSLSHRGSVAACGLVGGVELTCSVLPFLLRGVNLLGIDSGFSPLDERREAWGRLTREMPIELLDGMTHMATLGELPDLSKRILKGEIRGRTVIDVNS
jgi:acrylyl-CoA reductase (NADPH)